MDNNELHNFREEWECEIKKEQRKIKLGKDETAGGANALHSIHVHDGVINEAGTTSKVIDHTTHETSSQTIHALGGDNQLQKNQLISKKQKLTPVPLLTLDIPSYQIRLAAAENEKVDQLSSTMLESMSHHHGNQDLICQLIQDIDETTTVPFFDISLPKEVCVKIFSHLDVTELCRCACVSKSWLTLSNDELIWYNMYNKLGFKCQDETIGEQTDWKGIVRDSVLKQHSMTRNWKERICQIQSLEYEKGGALCACQIYKNLLIAGYTNGKTCLWNIESNWRHSLEPSLDILEDPAEAAVECVSVVGDVCATGFTCGVVNVWHADISIHPIYQYKLSKPAQHMVLTSCKAPILLTCSGPDVRTDAVQDDGQWGLVNSKSFDSQIAFINLLLAANQTTLLIAMKEDIVMYNPMTDGLTNLDKIAGTKITSVTSSGEHVAVGWAPFGFGMGTEFTAKARLYDAKSGKHLESFLGHYGDITCLNLSSKDRLVTGCKDKRVRVYDIRTEQPQLSLQGHSSFVTTVQMDSWKVVSGAFDGTLKVWDIRMGVVLWETRNTHPVRLCQFDSTRLVTANIPLDKVPRESMWYADDLILHRRHRGSIKVYDFSADLEDDLVPQEMRSNYDDISGYNYNINLVAPYDALTSEIS